MSNWRLYTDEWRHAKVYRSVRFLDIDMVCYCYDTGSIQRIIPHLILHKEGVAKLSFIGLRQRTQGKCGTVVSCLASRYSRGLFSGSRNRKYLDHNRDEIDGILH